MASSPPRPLGVGIDKRDVRAVIHAAVPETLDRFYQEVGRGGRDGGPSASFLIYSRKDQETVHQIASPSLISDDLAFERWSTMYGQSEQLDTLGHLLELDLSVVPPRLRRQSDHNESWNMRTLIMMARAGMLELASQPPSRIAQQEVDISVPGRRQVRQYDRLLSLADTQRQGGQAISR